MDIRALVGVIQTNKCKVRMKVRGYSAPEGWNDWAIIPTAGYIEINGPWPIRQVDWVEINPIVTEHIGRLVPPKRIDSSMQIEEGLRQADISYIVLDGIIRISFPDTAY
ncbi:DUF6678 family protein [Hymenobacter cheonanensis]|uniref:DUF6678 family protein n=1 Tax=Hymenobacter sp. CA2-7 TaxID=3063993 RepID=UPI00350EC838